MEFRLERSGYITKYLYSGRKETEITEDTGSDTNQLRYERDLRGRIARHDPISPQEDISLGENSMLGLPWKYYYSHGNIFMDVSAFYVELRRIDLVAATQLVAAEDMDVKAYLWSCAAVDLWVNGVPAGSIDRPVYKPITRKEVVLPLKKGVNKLFFRLETLGVRDTRISFAIQVLERREEIKVSLPDPEGATPCFAAEEIMDSAYLKDGSLEFIYELPKGSSICYHTETIDFKKIKERTVREDVSGLKKITLNEKYASFHVEIALKNGRLKRSFERSELRTPVYIESKPGQHQEAVFERIGRITSIIREETDGFALYPMLARFHLGQQTKEDENELRITLRQINRRMDCSDFMVCALIRFLKNYEVTEEIRKEIKEVMLNFRYWMDEEGQDGMCFWSENHSLMFYQAAYFFGQEYKEDIFARSLRTGKEMHERARLRLSEWLEDACGGGFDEFNSGVYTPITFAAILNIADYAEEELARKATAAADRLLRSLAPHCFKKVIISPQGRIYRDVLYPHRQSLQAIVHYMDGSAPYVYSEWLSTLATSKYQFPEDLKELMELEGAYTYNSSNACIDLYKTQDYILTSVQSPRRDGKQREWEADRRETEREKYLYTKSLNECFHGTMQFEPGVLGYQQHLWYAALDSDLVVFANHPGGSCEDMPEVRPGYWYGNGITPALKQEKNLLGAIYCIPDTFPVEFTHLYWNTGKFDRTVSHENWLFGCKGSSYIALWCSGELIDYDDVLFGCEKRTYGNKIAYLCICGSEIEEKNFEGFMEACLKKEVAFDSESLQLSCEEFMVNYRKHDNLTQYLE